MRPILSSPRTGSFVRRSRERLSAGRPAHGRPVVLRSCPRSHDGRQEATPGKVVGALSSRTRGEADTHGQGTRANARARYQGWYSRCSKSTTDTKPEMAILPARVTDKTCGCFLTSSDKRFSASNAGMGQVSTCKHAGEGTGHGG